MSFNTSLHKTPFLTGPLPPQEAVKPGSVAPPFLVQRDEDTSHTPKRDTQKQQNADHAITGSSQKARTDEGRSDFFKLLDYPDFSEFFRLAISEDGESLFLFIQNLRKHLGVDAYHPFTDIQKNAPGRGKEKRQTYRQNQHFFMAPCGKRFSGEM